VVVGSVEEGMRAAPVGESADSGFSNSSHAFQLAVSQGGRSIGKSRLFNSEFGIRNSESSYLPSMKKHYFLKLIPPRPSFAMDMTPDERSIMMQHVGYWTGLMQQGIAVVFGPVLDSAGVYGVGVVAVEDEEHLKSIIAGDPAVQVNRYEFWPMAQAVYKK
jgi:hypothetical protein